jgi:hypothetical protein
MIRISVASADGSEDGGKDLQAQIDYFQKKQEFRASIPPHGRDISGARAPAHLLSIARYSKKAPGASQSLSNGTKLSGDPQGLLVFLSDS